MQTENRLNITFLCEFKWDRRINNDCDLINNFHHKHSIAL